MKTAACSLVFDWRYKTYIQFLEPSESVCLVRPSIFGRQFFDIWQHMRLSIDLFDKFRHYLGPLDVALSFFILPYSTKIRRKDTKNCEENKRRKDRWRKTNKMFQTVIFWCMDFRLFVKRKMTKNNKKKTLKGWYNIWRCFIYTVQYVENCWISLENVKTRWKSV